MIKHIVMWKFKDDISNEKKKEIAIEFERQLHEVVILVDGVEHIEVVSNVLASSNMDLMLIGTYASEESLALYQKHPKHIEAALLLKDVVTSRSCVDY